MGTFTYRGGHNMGRDRKVTDLELSYLSGMGYTHDEMAEKLGVSRSTITSNLLRLKKESPELLNMIEVEEFRKQETDDLARLRQIILGSIRKKLNTTSLSTVSMQQLATLYGILFDKDRLLRGEATEHIATATYNQIDDKTREAIGDAVKQITQNMLDEAQHERELEDSSQL